MQLAFAYGAGPLMFSIILMRNSLVFHDFDKITTLMMHASPAITVWTLRWYSDALWVDALGPAAAAAAQVATWTEMIALPVAFYMIWLVIYYLLTFILLRNRIEGRGLLTMFTMLVPADREKAMKSAGARLVLKFSPPLQPFVYQGCHAICATVAFLPVGLMWDHYWVHTAALMFCLCMSVWNGGNYYFYGTID